VGNVRVNLTGGRTMTVDPAGKTVYVLTTSGLSVIPIGGANAQNLPQVPGNGVVDTANFQSGIAPGGLVSLFGTNLAASATANAPLPNILGGVCVTLNNTPLPLLATSSTQINAQIPPSLASGRYSLEVRSIANQMASSATNVTVAKYAPAIFVDAQGPAIFHQNGTRVNQSNPANRDEPLTIYATGLGTTIGGAVVAGQPSPSAPLAVTSTVQVFFGDPSWVQAQLIVNWSGLLPGSIGVYQIQCRVPGFHISGNALPVTLRMGGVSSVSGSSAPTVSVN
jgi:uncharacterized protein (TIGR03437 family)